MEKIMVLKNKLRTGKCIFSKSSTKAQEDLENFRKNKETAPKKRLRRLAEESLESLALMRDKLKIVRQAGDNLIGEIDEQGSKVDKADELVKQINTELDDYDEKMVEFRERNDGIILEIEVTLSSPEETQIQQVVTDKSGWRAFKPQSALKPNFLEKESTHLETKHFTELLRSYILYGFQGDPRESAIHIHLQPLIEPTWWQSLVQRGVADNKSLEQVIGIIMAESDARNPLHSRRMELL